MKNVIDLEEVLKSVRKSTKSIEKGQTYVKEHKHMLKEDKRV